MPGDRDTRTKSESKPDGSPEDVTRINHDSIANPGRGQNSSALRPVQGESDREPASECNMQPYMVLNER